MTRPQTTILAVLAALLLRAALAFGGGMYEQRYSLIGKPFALFYNPAMICDNFGYTLGVDYDLGAAKETRVAAVLPLVMPSSDFPNDLRSRALTLSFGGIATEERGRQLSAGIGAGFAPPNNFIPLRGRGGLRLGVSGDYLFYEDSQLWTTHASLDAYIFFLGLGFGLRNAVASERTRDNLTGLSVGARLNPLLFLPIDANFTWYFRSAGDVDRLEGTVLYLYETFLSLSMRPRPDGNVTPDKRSGGGGFAIGYTFVNNRYGDDHSRFFVNFTLAFGNLEGGLFGGASAGNGREGGFRGTVFGHYATRHGMFESGHWRRRPAVPVPSGVGRPMSAIRSVVAQNAAPLRSAYNALLREKPEAEGMITVRFMIDEDGAVIFAEMVESTMNEPEFEAFVVGQTRGLDFGKGSPGVTEVVYPFSFVPARRAHTQPTAAARTDGSVEIDSFIDPRDNKVYRTVRIGNRTWFADNLNFETAESWCNRNNDPDCVKYGRYYTWTAAMNIEARYDRNVWLGTDVNHQGICPEGWRMPSDEDWDDLIAAAGGRKIAGTRLRSRSGWGRMFRDTSATDDFGFTALPGGIRSLDGSFFGTYERGVWWSSTGDDGRSNSWNARWYPRNASYMVMRNYSGYVDRLRNDKRFAFSVRCVRD